MSNDSSVPHAVEVEGNGIEKKGQTVQGGSGTPHHLDGMLASLGLELGERPRLVHRLDRDTSGVIVVAKRRSVAAARGPDAADRGLGTAKVGRAFQPG